MILIYPNPEHRLIDMRNWCADQFGPSSSTSWGMMVPEFMYMFIREELATAFMLKFGGKIYERKY